MNGRFIVAAVQAAYVLLDRDATLNRVEELVAEAAGLGAELVVFTEAFVPGTPLWIDARPIWEGDGPWYARLGEQAVVVPGPATARIGATARAHRAHLVIGVQEREPHGSTIYNRRPCIRLLKRLCTGNIAVVGSCSAATLSLYTRRQREIRKS